ncbi:MAG: diguanylate cyclase [Clostridiales bacterium]|jgi:diguanylate cyclase (GGDEF)-like protein/PAS domain S-box-containing protein|nr:diguanylate cyclase [Clostridiales bacterium]
MNLYLHDVYYRLIFENSPDAIMLTGLDGSIFMVNRAACDLLGKTENEICRYGLSGIVGIDERSLTQLFSRLEQNGKLRAELTFIKNDGRLFPADVTAQMFNDERGKLWSVTTIRDISERKQSEEELRDLQREMAYNATYDFLTGVLNRRAFIDKLNQEMNRAQRDRMPMSLILLDVDSFKQINDTNGHLAGDFVLKKVAKCLAEHLRSYDLLGRYGGDEFILCLPNTAFDQATTIAERLRSNIEKAEIKNESSFIKVTASMGVACHYYTSSNDINALIAKVDDNMYRAKIRKNCVVAQ